MSEPRFPFVLVDVEADDADVTSALLFDLGAQGVEERDATTLIRASTPGKVTLVASFASHDEANEAIGEIDPKLAPRLEEIVGDAWRDAWKEHFRPFEIAKGIVVRPPWEPYEGDAKVVLELEPGRAFGTGLHETTSLVAGVLAERAAELAGQDVLDVGTGSGILALLALKLGASRARATDVDADAIAVACENAARNKLAERLSADTKPVGELAGAYPMVLANIEAKVLVPMANALRAKVAPGGLLVLSGILAPQKGEVLAAYPGFELLVAPEKGEWVALVLRAPIAAGGDDRREGRDRSTLPLA
jgi:ribosomal protein L11 methyltransferase